MTWPPWLRRLVPYLGRRQAREELQEELRLHSELERERQLDAGATETEARRSVLRKLGSMAAIREDVDAVWSWRWLDDLVGDLRHAVRGLRRSPGVTATVVIVLAMGIGANSATFSIVYGMLLRPLPYPDSDAIVRIGESYEADAGWSPSLSNRSILALQEEAESFEQLAAYGPAGPVVWAGPHGSVTLRGARVSPALFPLLRAVPRVGRLFTEGESRAGADGVALLSFDTWNTHFASDPDVVGAVLEQGGGPLTVVGVLSEGFSFPSPDVDVWTPLVIPPFEIRESPDGRGFRTLSFSLPAVGRLRPGVSAAQAATEVRSIVRRPAAGISAEAGQAGLDPPPGHELELDAHIVPLQEAMVRRYRPALTVLAAAGALVLLIACVNVAGLLLARGITRQRELAVRRALGAARGRIVRQLLSESVVLSFGGGVLGLAAAAAVLQAVPLLVPGDIARLDEVSVGGAVLVFSFGLTTVVGLLFGTAPALLWSRPSLLRFLNEGSARAAGGFRLLWSNRLRAVLAAAQIALATVLLISAGLLVRSFVALITADRGYDPSNVVTVRLHDPDNLLRPDSLTLGRMDEIANANRRLYSRLLGATDRLSSLPGVSAAGLTSRLPLAGRGWSSIPVSVAGRPVPDNPADYPQASLLRTSPGYFEVMRMRLRAGRFFIRVDEATNRRVLVVNETFERQAFGGESAVGKRLYFGVGAARSGGQWEIVGVVADTNYDGLALADTLADVFVPIHGAGISPESLTFGPPVIVARTTGDPLSIVPFLREAVADVYPRASIDDVMTMNARLSVAVTQPRFYAILSGLVAGFALLLAVSGVYGLVSYTVAQRRGEIGIRTALGAERSDVVTLVVRQGALLIAVGTVGGWLTALATGRVLESWLFGVTSADRLTLIAALLVLVAVAVVACWLPARRATQVDPAETLRFE